MTAVRAVVSGRVQGVSYRAWTADTARALGLSGWVRNLRDGRVEALLSGDRADEMIARMREGPRHARVTGIETEVVDAPDGDGFEIRW